MESKHTHNMSSPPAPSTHIDLIRADMARADTEFFQRRLLSGIRTVAQKTIRDMEDARFESIVEKSQSIPMHTFEFPEKKPVLARTAEDWFVDSYKTNEKLRDPSAVVRNEVAQKKWRDVPEEEKKPYVQKANEDKARFDHENQVYQDQKRLVSLSSSDALRLFQDWNENVNVFLHGVDSKISRIVMELAASLTDITNKPIGSTNTKSSVPRASSTVPRATKRKREVSSSGPSSKQDASGGKSKRRAKSDESTTTAEGTTSTSRKSTQSRSKETKEGKPSGRGRGRTTNKGSGEEKEKKSRGKAAAAAPDSTGEKPAGKAPKTSTKTGGGGGGTRPYNLYCKQFKQNNPELADVLTNEELKKKAGIEWKQMTPEEKQPFIQSAMASKPSRNVDGATSPIDEPSVPVVTEPKKKQAPPKSTKQTSSSNNTSSSVVLPPPPPASPQVTNVPIPSQHAAPQSGGSSHSFFEDSPEREDDFTSFDLPSASDNESGDLADD